ncbi:hypothetical protein ACFL4J_00565 [Candidatus Margulisiibacteriota bacterium]
MQKVEIIAIIFLAVMVLAGPALASYYDSEGYYVASPEEIIDLNAGLAQEVEIEASLDDADVIAEAPAVEVKKEPAPVKEAMAAVAKPRVPTYGAALEYMKDLYTNYTAEIVPSPTAN